MILLLHYRMSNNGLTNETVIKFERIFFCIYYCHFKNFYLYLIFHFKCMTCILTVLQPLCICIVSWYECNRSPGQRERPEEKVDYEPLSVAAITACCFKTASRMAQCNPHLDKCTVHCLLPHRDIVPKVSNPCSPQIKMKWNTCSVGWCCTGCKMTTCTSLPLQPPEETMPRCKSWCECNAKLPS